MIGLPFGDYSKGLQNTSNFYMAIKHRARISTSESTPISGVYSNILRRDCQLPVQKYIAFDIPNAWKYIIDEAVLGISFPTNTA
jgi:hypothetical protein